jgi:hypothetical protein
MDGWMDGWMDKFISPGIEGFVWPVNPISGDFHPVALF